MLPALWFRRLLRRSSARANSVCALVVLALAAASLVAAQPVSAQIVWSKGGEIWTMNDDGTGQRVLVALSAAPGMNELRAPGAHPSGSAVTFEGSTWVNKVTNNGLCGTFPTMYPCVTTHYGFYGTGTYRWAAGKVERLSPPAAYCWNCSSGPSDPEPRADGSVVSTFTHCQGFLGDGTYDCDAAINASSGEAYPSCVDVASASPNPATPSQVLHTGCTSAGTNALVVTGPDRAGERVVACDDGEQNDPAWSPDGSQIVAAEGGTDPGLWVYGAGNTACFAGALRHAVIAPAGQSFWSPAFVGASRIVFESQGELWSVAAGCDRCAFPGAATQLTSGANNSAPTWTSDPLVAPTTPGGATTPGGGTTPTSGAAPDVVAPSADLSKTTKTQKVGKTRKLTLKLTASEGATLTVTGAIKVTGKDPKLGPVTQPLVAGTPATVKVRLGSSAMKALNAAWAKRKTPVARLQLTLKDATGNSRTVRREVKLRR
ncbi:MAG: hypothetical protein JHD16_14855 [Solirubrobacteraceae bacterium]|nr:hypothetical protein [Solirubrobacteraceae bacterium]